MAVELDRSVVLRVFLVLLLFLGFCKHAVGQRVRIETKAGQTFDAVCPTKHYVSRVQITREVIAPTNVTGFRFLVECDSFVTHPATDTGTESCQVLLPIPLLYYDLQWDDYERNCDCNEYLAGIRSEHFGEKWDGALAGRERRIQLVCCRADNRRLDGDRCGYTGHESLFAPWREVEVGTARFTGGKQQGVIQSLFFSGGYVNSRICAWDDSPVARIGDFDEANGCYERWSCRRTAGKGTCYDRDIEQFGWTEPLVYFDTTGVATYTKSEPYSRQEHICRTGQRVVSIRKVMKNSKPPDYGLFVSCGSTGSVFPCYCYWMPQCSILDTWYVAGVRSYWDKASQRRQLELLCCKTNGFRTTECREGAALDQKQNSIELSSKQANDGGAVEFIRNIATVDQNSSLRFNICTGIFTNDWCVDGYDDPCYRCSRKQSDQPVTRSLPAPRPPPITAASGSQTSGGVWHSTQYSGRGSSGWGDVWWTRPVITRTVNQPPVVVVAPPACKPGTHNGYHDPKAGGWVNHHHGGSSSHGGTKGGGGTKHNDGHAGHGDHDGHSQQQDNGGSQSGSHQGGTGGSNDGGKSGHDGHSAGGWPGHEGHSNGNSGGGSSSGSNSNSGSNSADHGAHSSSSIQNGHSSSSSHNGHSSSSSHSNGEGRAISEYHHGSSSHSGHSIHSGTNGGSSSVSGGTNGASQTGGGTQAGASHGASAGGTHGGSHSANGLRAASAALSALSIIGAVFGAGGHGGGYHGGGGGAHVGGGGGHIGGVGPVGGGGHGFGHG